MGGHTLLSEAAYGGSLEAVRYLVERQGCNIEEKNDDDSRPVFWACQRGHEAIVDYLKSRGARFDDTATGGWTCLTEAAFGGHLQLVTRLIDEERLDPHHPIVGGRTALHRAVEGHHTPHWMWSDFLAEKVGLDPHKPAEKGWSAFLRRQ